VSAQLGNFFAMVQKGMLLKQRVSQHARVPTFRARRRIPNMFAELGHAVLIFLFAEHGVAEEKKRLENMKNKEKLILTGSAAFKRLYGLYRLL
jgi:hypothetical protein